MSQHLSVKADGRDPGYSNAAIRCRHPVERNQVYSRSGRENLSKQCESWVPDTGKVIGADERYSGSDNTATKLGTAALIKKSR